MALSIRSGPKPAGALNEHSELRASRWGRLSARATLRVAETRPGSLPQFCRFRAARSGVGRTAQRAGPAVLRTAKAQSHSPPPILLGSSSARLHRAANASLSPRTAILESRYSLSDQIPAQISSPYSAQRSTKTVSGFRARRTVAAQSKAQFSAPCQLHCGSAVAPPHFRRPLGFHLDFAVAK